MRDQQYELTLGLLEVLDRFIGHGVLDGYAALVSHRAQEARVLVSETSSAIAVDADDAKGPGLSHQRCCQCGPDALSRSLGSILQPRIGSDVGYDHDLAPKYLLGKGVLIDQDTPFLEISLTKPIGAGEAQFGARAVKQADGTALYAHGLGCAAREPVENLLEFQGRAHDLGAIV